MSRIRPLDTALRWGRNFFTNVWQSIVRHGYPDNDRDRSEMMFQNVFLHIMPVRVHKHTLKPTFTLGLGLIAFFLFVQLVITGVLLMFYYVPDVNRAYSDMKDIEFVVSYGMLLRNMHRWAAHAMVALVFLHMARVFFTASYKPPRELNWVIGVFLFVTTLLLSFTGYLLPWDQLAFWAITVGTNIASSAPVIGETFRYALLGGNLVGQNALLRFYVLHIMVLPIAAAVFMVIHFWRIRKDGGLSRPEEETFPLADQPAKVFVKNPHKTYGLMMFMAGTSPGVDKGPDNTFFSVPHLLMRILLVFLGSTVGLILFSLFVNAPLESLADPTTTPNPSKAPWYFLGLQEMVSWARPVWGGVIAPGLIILGLILIPYLDRDKKGIGVWFSPHRKLACTLFLIFAVAMTVVIVIGTFMRGPNWGFFWPWQPWPH